MPVPGEAISQYIGLLVQVPLVGIFIFFTLKLISIFIGTVDKFLAALKERDEQWKSFLEEQRKINNEVIKDFASRLGEEMKKVTSEVAKLEGILLAIQQERKNK